MFCQWKRKENIYIKSKISIIIWDISHGPLHMSAKLRQFTISDFFLQIIFILSEYLVINCNTANTILSEYNPPPIRGRHHIDFNILILIFKLWGYSVTITLIEPLCTQTNITCNTCTWRKYLVQLLATSRKVNLNLEMDRTTQGIPLPVQVYIE